MSSFKLFDFLGHLQIGTFIDGYYILINYGLQ